MFWTIITELNAVIKCGSNPAGDESIATFTLEADTLALLNKPINIAIRDIIFFIFSPFFKLNIISLFTIIFNISYKKNTLLEELIK